MQIFSVSHIKLSLECSSITCPLCCF